MDRWFQGGRVGSSVSAGVLARRLVDAGLVHPRPGANGRPRESDCIVVVPVHDDDEGLAATLSSLAATAPTVPVVVVDDASATPARLPSSARPAAARVIRRQVRGGPGAARNTGWGHARGAAVAVFVDAGCVLGGQWLTGLLAHFADPHLGAVAPRVVSRPGSRTPAGLAAYESAHSPLDMGPREGPVRPGSAIAYVPTATLAVRGTAMAKVQGFDESLRFGEDVDLVWRLYAGGWRVRYEPAVEVTHPARPTWRALLRQRFDYGRSAAPLAARHGSAVAPLAVSPWSAVASISLLGGRRGLAASAVLAVAGSGFLARQAGRDRAVAAELGRLALAGRARTAASVATAVRRAWLPVALLTLWPARLVSRAASRRAVVALCAAMLCDGPLDWCRRRPPVDPLRWSAWRLADDLVYQGGVWSGVVAARSAAALLPRLPRGRTVARTRPGPYRALPADPRFLPRRTSSAARPV